jgi:hypothetical protein
MKTLFFRSTQFLVSLGLLFVPFASASAYFTTSQQALKVTDTSALYIIQFEFGHDKHEIHIPILAKNTTEQSRSFLSYGLFDDSGNRIPGAETAGIVISDTPIQGTEYVTPLGKDETFTLLVVANLPDGANANKVHVGVNYLPFTFDGTLNLQLNPSELQYYATPSLTF